MSIGNYSDAKAYFQLALNKKGERIMTNAQIWQKINECNDKMRKKNISGFAI